MGACLTRKSRWLVKTKGGVGFGLCLVILGFKVTDVIGFTFLLIGSGNK